MMDFCDECDAVIEGKTCKKCNGDKEESKEGEGDGQDGAREEDVSQEIKDRWEKWVWCTQNKCQMSWESMLTMTCIEKKF